MILSLEDLLSDKQAITASAVSTNIKDFGLAGTPVNRALPTGGVAQLVADQGKGEPLPFLFQVNETFDALTSLEVQIQKSVDAAFTSPIVVQSQVLLLADLVIGQMGEIQWAPLKLDLQFMRMNYIVTGSNPTVGQITAGFSMGNQTNE